LIWIGTDIAEEGLIEHLLVRRADRLGQQELRGDLEDGCNLADLLGRWFRIVFVFQFPDVALAGVGQFGQLFQAELLLFPQCADLVPQGRWHRYFLICWLQSENNTTTPNAFVPA
jgi:hypothetical protein